MGRIWAYSIPSFSFDNYKIHNLKKKILHKTGIRVIVVIVVYASFVFVS